MATSNRRQATDETISYERNKNDALTQERRFEADKTMGKNRAKNDRITADRRRMKDSNRSPNGGLALFLLIIIILAFGAYIIFY